MKLIATGNFHLRPKGPMDEEPPLVMEGEIFEPVALGTMSAHERALSLIAQGWAKKAPEKKLGDDK